MITLRIFVLFTIIVGIYSTATPIIGILSQETYIVSKYLPDDDNYTSFIAASYVKFLESAGARVVPVWTGQKREYYERVVKYTNGMLFPGGGTYFNVTDGYGEAAKQIYDLAVESNNKGIYYPVWGICLGMQVLVFSQIGIDIRINSLLKKVALPLDFVEGYKDSKLYSKTPKHVLHILEGKNVTYNFHQYGLTEDVLRKHDILDDWHILSTNKDTKNLTFISSMESKNYPVYGLQFHPEKNIFEFKKDAGIPHSSSAVRISQFFSNFFVDECRKNTNTFPSSDVETEALIYNYLPLYTGSKGSSYEQLYAFTENDYKKCPLVESNLV